MKKALVPLALALALVTPLANAGRAPVSSDQEPAPFGEHNLHPARDVAALAGLEHGSYRTLVVGAAVPGAQSAQCQAKLLGARGTVLEVATLEVPAGSNAQLDFADRIGIRMAVGAQVSCNQPFYAYAAAAGADEPKVTWGEQFGPNAPCDFTVTAAELTPGVFVATQDGTVHLAAKGKPKGVVCIKVPKDLVLDKMVLEWQVTPAAWSKKPSGNHNMLFLHRGRFRSNTVSNVNAFGPNKNYVKIAQNIDLAPKASTNTKLGVALKNGTPYTIRYTYDAANKRVTAELYDSGALVKTVSMDGSAKNRALTILAHGLSEKGSLFAEFGHFADQEPPEMPSFGWRYSNLRVEMTVKK